MNVENLKNTIRRLKNKAKVLDYSKTLTVKDYWTKRNVTHHHVFSSREESLDYFDWRSKQYINYIELMPVEGQNAKVVLDYGCGPGHDLVGFCEFSNPHKLYALDVSPTSLAEAKSRLKYHKNFDKINFIQIEPGTAIPLADGSVDYIHSSGVLHHVENLSGVLRELSRVLAPGGKARFMVYNYNSIWMHLYVAYKLRLVDGKFADMPIREAFRRSTDGELCPIANCYTPSEFSSIVESNGFSSVQFLGAAIDSWEMRFVPERFNALLNRRLEKVHRDFIYQLTFDNRGIPYYQGAIAGIDIVFECTK